MSFTSISDLPSSVSSLTRIQKSHVLSQANRLIKSGKSNEDALAQAVGSVLVQKSADVDSDLMVSYEIIYEPDTPDAHGQWMSKPTLEKAQQDFKKAQEIGAVTENLMHILDTDTFSIVDHWIQKEFDVSVAETGEVIKAGTWVAKVQYNSPEVWEMKKAGIYGGLSLQCGGMLDEATGELSDLNFNVEIEEDDNE